MKLFVAGLNQETNSFCPSATDRGLFERGYVLTGQQIPEVLKNTNSEIWGFYEYFRGKREFELVPGFAAWAVPSGPVLDKVLDEFIAEILNALNRSLPVDGVLLSLHGAMVSESREDCEGHLMKEVRRVVGDDIPVVGTLDYHTVFTKDMVDAADALFTFRTYPHIDYMDTGVRGAGCIEKLLRRPRDVHRVFRKIPMIVPVENSETGTGPMAEAIRMLEELDRDPGVLAASLCCSQPWADVSETGISVVLYTESGDAAYKNQAAAILDYIWSVRKEFIPELPSIRDVLKDIRNYRTPVLLVDSGDITSAGASGDSTVVLDALLEFEEPLRAVLTVVDRETAVEAFSAGEGVVRQFAIGGKDDRGYNKKIPLTARIIRTDDKRVEVKGPSFSGFRLDMGKRALLQTEEGLSIIVSEFTSLIHDPEVLRSMGVQPEEQDIIVQKSHKIFRPAYKDIARTILLLDSPGFSDPNLTRLPFKRVPRPFFPFDEM